MRRIPTSVQIFRSITMRLSSIVCNNIFIRTTCKFLFVELYTHTHTNIDVLNLSRVRCKRFDRKPQNSESFFCCLLYAQRDVLSEKSRVQTSCDRRTRVSADTGCWHTLRLRGFRKFRPESGVNTARRNSVVGGTRWPRRVGSETVNTAKSVRNFFATALLIEPFDYGIREIPNGTIYHGTVRVYRTFFTVAFEYGDNSTSVLVRVSGVFCIQTFVGRRFVTGNDCIFLRLIPATALLFKATTGLVCVQDTGSRFCTVKPPVSFVNFVGFCFYNGPNMKTGKKI